MNTSGDFSSDDLDVDPTYAPNLSIGKRSLLDCDNLLGSAIKRQRRDSISSSLPDGVGDSDELMNNTPSPSILPPAPGQTTELIYTENLIFSGKFFKIIKQVSFSNLILFIL